MVNKQDLLAVLASDQTGLVPIQKGICWPPTPEESAIYHSAVMFCQSAHKSVAGQRGARTSLSIGRVFYESPHPLEMYPLTPGQFTLAKRCCGVGTRGNVLALLLLRLIGLTQLQRPQHHGACAQNPFVGMFTRALYSGQGLQPSYKRPYKPTCSIQQVLLPKCCSCSMLGLL